jgi:signal transduction histidine kinase
MRLSSFIRENTKPIIAAWESFVKTLVTSSEEMDSLTLHDHMQEILIFIADDIEAPQTKSEQKQKSLGKKPHALKPSAAKIHASLRHDSGFNMNQMVSEYRALRASVIKLWDSQLTEFTRQHISDLTRFNEAIDQALTESISDYTKKLDTSRNLFLGVLGHDLRNPLGAIQMCARLILSIGSLNKKQVMLVNQVDESSQRITEILDHLLDFTRARLGSSISITKDQMNMGSLSKQLVNEMRSIYPTHTFNVETSGDLEGQWDKARIGQVLSNLLGNAVQYGFKGTPITISVESHQGEVVLAVNNEGNPIPRNSIDTIFNSFTRAEINNDGSQSESVNLGLGLYITKEIVFAHGGTINVISSRKDGTTFVARFPRLQ